MSKPDLIDMAAALEAIHRLRTRRVTRGNQPEIGRAIEEAIRSLPAATPDPVTAADRDLARVTYATFGGDSMDVLATRVGEFDQFHAALMAYRAAVAAEGPCGMCGGSGKVSERHRNPEQSCSACAEGKQS